MIFRVRIIAAPIPQHKSLVMNKKDLPSKVCVVCNRPFNWRKKWEKVWPEVRYCSDRCRRNKNKVRP